MENQPIPDNPNEPQKPSRTRVGTDQPLIKASPYRSKSKRLLEVSRFLWGNKENQLQQQPTPSYDDTQPLQRRIQELERELESEKIKAEEARKRFNDANLFLDGAIMLDQEIVD